MVIKNIKRRRALLLVLPLLAFLTVFFIAPLIYTLSRAVSEPELRALMPQLSASLDRWEDVGNPPEVVIEAFITDIAAAQKQRRLGVLVKRVASMDSSMRAPLTNAARKAAADASFNATQLMALDPVWQLPATWGLVRKVVSPITDRYLLATIDLERDNQGNIQSVPAEGAIFLDTIVRTFAISFLVTALCFMLAYPLAYFMVHQSATVQAIMLIFVMLPFWTSILVRTAAWLVLLQTHGVINDTLVSLGVLSQPVQLVYNRVGTILAMIHIQLPFTLLPIYSVMKSISPVYARAAQSLGAPPLASFRRIYFPMTMPGVAAGCLLTFILCLGYYITPALLGGPSDQLLSYYVAYYLNQEVNWSMAAAVSTILLAITLVVYVIYNRYVELLRQVEG
ncbi:ABC transporter permease [Brucella tritici]|uniref:ABC transporter permease n=1 Tax=Brucella tritici TaxID=94626 RepID=UPI00124D55B0|nr:ABC transporter permease [Brucella tritici]KAB2671746.1 ABC transporter permease [Brucella tritici]